MLLCLSLITTAFLWCVPPMTSPPSATAAEVGNMQVSAGDSHTVGVKANRTVIATGDNRYGQCDVGSWSDIAQVSA